MSISHVSIFFGTPGIYWVCIICQAVNIICHICHMDAFTLYNIPIR